MAPKNKAQGKKKANAKAEPIPDAFVPRSMSEMDMGNVDYDDPETCPSDAKGKKNEPDGKR